MRRLTLAALSAALALSACSDNTRESPTEPSSPSPEETFGGSCQVVRFPLGRAVELINTVFPKGRLQLEAKVRAAGIALLWNTCKAVFARKGVVAFVEFMNRNSASLTGPEAQVKLIDLMFTGVGLASPPPIPPGPDFGVGGVDPAAKTPTLIETRGSTALIEFLPAQAAAAVSGAALQLQSARPAAFDEFTIVTITRRPDDFRLSGFPPEDQLPPFFDYTASNASNNHVLNPGSVATMVFCFLGGTDFPNPNGYPDGVRIGHNPDPLVPGPRFEILSEAAPSSLAGNLQCSNLEPTSGPPLIGGFGGGVSAFARSAWSAAGHYLRPIARTLFLPQPVQAAMIVGGRGPLHGLPTNLSDHGVVNATSYFGYEDEEPAWSATGFWDRRTSASLTNAAFTGEYVATSGGALPTPFRGEFSGWYGDPQAGNYLGPQIEEGPGTGGTSEDPNTGAFLSPELEVPNVAAEVELRFKTWWEIEGENPSSFDIMAIEVWRAGVLVAQTTLNPEGDPQDADREARAYTSDGFDTAPTWEDVVIDISAFKGDLVRIRFVFNTLDVNYNGFRGWLVDDVRISTGTSEDAGPGPFVRKLLRSQVPLIPADQLPPRARP